MIIKKLKEKIASLFELKGVGEIAQYLRLQQPCMVIDLKVYYDLPVYMKNGIWCAKKSKLKRWKKDYQSILKPFILPDYVRY